MCRGTDARSNPSSCDGKALTIKNFQQGEKQSTFTTLRDEAESAKDKVYASLRSQYHLLHLIVSTAVILATSLDLVGR